MVAGDGGWREGELKGCLIVTVLAYINQVQNVVDIQRIVVRFVICEIQVEI